MRTDRRGGLGLAGLALLFALGACGEGTASVEAEHTEGEYIWANHPLYWNDSSYASFRQITDANSWWPNPQPVAEDDVSRRWLQVWADQIDAIVRADTRADTGEELVAPKPIMHLLPSSSISNAWVTAVPACVPWQVRAKGAPVDASTSSASSSSGAGGAGDGGAGGADATTSTGAGAGPAGNQADAILFDHYGKSVHEPDRDGDATLCVPRDDFAPFADRFLAAWNESTPSCSARLAPDGAIEVEPTCLGAFTGASKSAIYAISPHIQFSSDLLAAGTEGGAVFVVAHELAHFYRAHGSPLARHRYGFWYDQNARTPRRPVPSGEAKELEKLYREVEGMPRASAAVIPGATHAARYRAVVLDSICTYLGARATEEGVDASCSEAAALCQTVAPLRYASVASDEQVAAYLALEPKLDACGTVEKLESLEAPALAGLIVSLQGKGYLPGGPAENVPLPRSFGALLGSLRDAAAAQDAKVAKFAERLRLGRIGLYTTEQEADDLALEWVNKLGFSTDQALDGWLTYLTYFERGYTPAGEPTAAECRALYDSNFKNGNAFVTVWLGDLDSAHHGGCYRVYNLWREQRAHRYVPASSIARPDFATWDEVREHAKQLSQ